MINLVKQADGNYAVNLVDPGGTRARFLGIVGRDDAGGWFATHSAQQRGPGTMSAAYFYVNALRTRKAAVETLMQWHDAGLPKLVTQGGAR